MTTVGSRIRKLREQRSMSLQDLADGAKISKTYLWQVENGRVGQPSAQKLLAIARALETTIASLLGQPVVKVDDEEIEIPASLADFLRRAAGVTEAEKKMLAGIQYRGKRPSSADDWAFIYETIKRATRRAD